MDKFDLSGPDAALLAVESTGIRDQFVPASHLTVEIHFTHQSCPEYENWRREGGAGFPRFMAFLHERYNRDKTYLECEACKTTISHAIVQCTKTESA
jgi:hypothetical protein